MHVGRLAAEFVGSGRMGWTPLDLQSTMPRRRYGLYRQGQGEGTLTSLVRGLADAEKRISKLQLSVTPVGSPAWERERDHVDPDPQTGKLKPSNRTQVATQQLCRSTSAAFDAVHDWLPGAARPTARSAEPAAVVT